MSASLRSGKYGSYYGSTFSESEPLTENQMKVNAEYIYKYLAAKGWTMSAVAGMLGNMQAESSINPGRWQSDDVGWESGGYGLVQWTPTTKYINWCTSEGYDDPSEMDNNLARIIYEVENQIQWYATDSYNLSFEEFTKSGADAGYLAKAFLLNYERPADQSESVQEYRANNGLSWFSYLATGDFEIPDMPDIPIITTKKSKKYKFVLFNKRRRNRWTNKRF